MSAHNLPSPTSQNIQQQDQYEIKDLNESISSSDKNSDSGVYAHQKTQNQLNQNEDSDKDSEDMDELINEAFYQTLWKYSRFIRMTLYTYAYFTLSQKLLSYVYAKVLQNKLFSPLNWNFYETI
ncbi:hypothetical protein PPERSA_12323 [Pseudocohnilembus persalinus]|uniref:Uncharacterized protein n=1 Tax=Pseudocohnilembus persalinus TaxID=266149 RepID=A0A0V0R1X6_PSEPJ|nr:hypothetical protein PPERSA_12323 [Pseudocohnilembus persalinus]|eukprot:KRX08168.1 hypothetical protein PPERSA_12323 [Pseudocohnilembus persalinus]